MTSDSAYRERVQANLRRVLEMLAHMSFGTESPALDTAARADGEFAEIFCGLAILRDDIAAARQALEAQSRFNLLRADVWKRATSGFLSLDDLIRALLEVIGPRLDVMRASYFRIHRAERLVRIDVQWVRPGVRSTQGLAFPLDLALPLLSLEHAELRPATLAVRGLRALVELMRQSGSGSLLAVRNGTAEQPFGFFAFSDADEERVWSDHEKDILLEIVAIVSTKLAQIRAEDDLRQTNIRLEQEVNRRTAELALTNRDLQADIEERKRVEGALRDSEELYRGLVETSPDAIVASDLAGVITMANRAALQMYGAGALEELAGRNSIDLVIPSERERALANARKTMSQGVMRNLRYRFARVDGSTFEGDMNVSVIKDARGAPRGFLAVIRDVTEQTKMESELLRARKLESVGLLAGGIAHDFNNILTGIITSIFLAKMNVKDNQEAYQLLTESEKAAFRASKLTKQLLTFSKGGAPVREVASLSEVLQDALSFSLSGSKVDYRLDIDPGLAAVEIDKGQIDQVLNNLILNADQAMPGGGTLEVTAVNVALADGDVPPLPAGPYVRVSLRDTGAGIAPENLQRIFDPYFTTKDHGTGLGLTTAYSIIRKHDGLMTVASEPGKGSTFSFYLPASSASAQVREQKTAAIAEGRGRILVMDDDEVVRSVMARLLRGAGYDTVSVNDGDAALQAYRRAMTEGAPFQAVIMDLTISGGKGGKETVKELLALDPEARAIVVSGYSNDPILADYRAYGFCGVLGKPFNVEEFTRTVRAAAQR